MLRRLLLACVLFSILGSGSGCCLLDRIVHCEKYCGPSCGPKYWGPYHVDRCDPCDTCGNFVGQGCACGGGHHGHYDDGHYHDGEHYDGEIIYEGPVRDAPVYENAVYEGSVHTHERKVPHVWRLP